MSQDFNKEIICRTIKEQYNSGNYPTCDNLKEILEHKTDFSGCAKSEWTTLTDMGYKYKKGQWCPKAFNGEKRHCSCMYKICQKKVYQKESPLHPVIYLDKTGELKSLKESCIAKF